MIAMFKAKKTNLLSATMDEMLDANLPFDDEIRDIAARLTSAQCSIKRLYDKEEARLGRSLHNVPGKLQLIEAIRFIYEAKIELTNSHVE